MGAWAVFGFMLPYRILFLERDMQNYSIEKWDWPEKHNFISNFIVWETLDATGAKDHHQGGSIIKHYIIVSWMCVQCDFWFTSTLLMYWDEDQDISSMDDVWRHVNCVSLRNLFFRGQKMIYFKSLWKFSIFLCLFIADRFNIPCHYGD